MPIKVRDDDTFHVTEGEKGGGIRNWPVRTYCTISNIPRAWITISIPIGPTTTVVHIYSGDSVQLNMSGALNSPTNLPPPPRTHNGLSTPDVLPSRLKTLLSRIRA